MILNEDTFAIESPEQIIPVAMQPQYDLKPQNNEVGVQTIITTQIQELYAILDSYTSGGVTCDELGYSDVSNVFEKYKKQILDQISYLTVLVGTLQPSVQILTNPLSGNEFTMI